MKLTDLAGIVADRRRTLVAWQREMMISRSNLPDVLTVALRDAGASEREADEAAAAVRSALLGCEEASESALAAVARLSSAMDAVEELAVEIRNRRAAAGGFIIT